MSIDPTKHSFSAAYGYEDLPQQLQPGELSEEARTGLWNAFFLTQNESYLRHFGIDPGWNDVLASVHADLFNLGLDTFSTDFNDINRIYRRYFAEAEINKVYDLILHIVRHENCPDEFHARVAAAFLKHRLAHAYDYKSRTIFPASTPEEGQAIIDAVRQLETGRLDGAHQHLVESANFINQGNWAKSVHESINAVESVACQIEPGSNTLGAALRKLRKQGKSAHPALNEGFEKLYGYTSDEQGRLVRSGSVERGPG